MMPHHDEALRSLSLADHDIVAFEALRRHPEVHPAITCFHAQQAVEKCMKATCSPAASSSAELTI